MALELEWTALVARSVGNDNSEMMSHQHFDWGTFLHVHTMIVPVVNWER
jgi:hypothetical protein